MGTAPVKCVIVDGTVEERLLDFPNEVNPPYCCLYVKPIQLDLVALTLYLVEVVPEVEAWLRDKVSPWGIYLTSESPMRELRQHFRHYLWVRIPEQEKPILIRFCGPRDMWVLTEVLTPRQLLFFISPVRQLSTRYGEGYHEDNFSSVRPAETMNIRAKRPSQLMLSYRQYSQLERKARDNYLDILSVFIEENAEKEGWGDSSKTESSRILAEDYFSFCQSLDIADDRSVRTMTLISLKKNIIDPRYIPDDWYELLSNQLYPGHIRVHELAQQELGFIPQQEDKRIDYMTSPSSTVGKPCVEYGIPDPCIFDVTSDFPEAGEKHFQSKEGMARFELLDDGFGCGDIITIAYQCDNSGIHEAWLEEESENSRKILQPFGKPGNVILYYEGFEGEMSVTDALHSPWEYLGSITVLHDVLYKLVHYTVGVNSYCEHNSYVEVEVYPSLEIRFITGLGYEISSSQQTRAIKDRRDERRKTREVIEDAEPRDKNKL